MFNYEYSVNKLFRNSDAYFEIKKSREESVELKNKDFRLIDMFGNSLLKKLNRSHGFKRGVFFLFDIIIDGANTEYVYNIIQKGSNGYVFNKASINKNGKIKIISKKLITNVILVDTSLNNGEKESDSSFYVNIKCKNIIDGIFVIKFNFQTSFEKDVKVGFYNYKDEFGELVKLINSRDNDAIYI